MKKIKFKKVGAQNFCNYVDPIDLEFEDGKLILITGRNGSGKSALIQAIPFTLYGSCEKGRSDDVLNNRVNKDCATYVEFEINNDLYRVERYVKYKSIGNSARILKNGVEYKKGSREVTSECERLLVPQKLFNNTMLFSQKVKTFFTDLTDSEQKDIFRKILQLDEFLDYYKITNEKISENEKIMLDATNNILSSELFLKNLEDQLNDLKNKEIEYENDKKLKIESFEKDQENLQLEISIIEKSINDIVEKYPNVEEDIQSLRIEFAEVRQEIINVDNLKNNEIEKITINFENDKKLLLSENETLNTSFDNDKNSKIISLKHEYELNTENNGNNLKNKKIELDNLKNDFISKNTLDLQSKISEINELNLNEKNKFLNKNKDEIDNLTNKFNNDKEIFVNKLNKLVIDKSKNETIILNYKNDIKKLEKDIIKFQNIINSDDKICPICLKSMDDVSELNNHISEIEMEIKKYLDFIEKSENDNISITKHIDEINCNIINLMSDFNNDKVIIENSNTRNLSGIIIINNEEIEKIKESLQYIENKIEKKYSDEYLVYVADCDKISFSLTEKYNNQMVIINNDYSKNISLNNDNYLVKLKNVEEIFKKNTLDIEDKYIKIKEKLQNNLTEISKDGNYLAPISNNLKEFENNKQSVLQKILVLKTSTDLCKTTYFDNSQFTAVKNSIEVVKEKIKNHIIEKNQYSDLINIYNFWKEGFSSSGIQSMLIDEAIPFMNSRSSEYLEKICLGRYSLSFDTMKETKSGELKDKINVNVFDTLTLSDARIKFSGGQERIIDIATILTLGDLQEKIQGISFNILLFDEIFDTLDDENIRYVSDLLKQISSEKSIVLISHRHINQIECDTHLNLN
jgi:DNA repair exonuclease SbcCD ATPase subunit